MTTKQPLTFVTSVFSDDLPTDLFQHLNDLLADYRQRGHVHPYGPSLAAVRVYDMEIWMQQRNPGLPLYNQPDEDKPALIEGGQPWILDDLRHLRVHAITTDGWLMVHPTPELWCRREDCQPAQTKP